MHQQFSCRPENPTPVDSREIGRDDTSLLQAAILHIEGWWDPLLGHETQLDVWYRQPKQRNAIIPGFGTPLMEPGLMDCRV